MDTPIRPETGGGHFSTIARAVNCPGQFSFDNGIAITRVEPGYAQGVLQVRPGSHNPHGTVHGGCLYTLADTVAGTACCGEGRSCVTVNSSMEFLRPAVGERVTCTATPKKLGRTLCVMQVELKDDGERLAATGTFTFFLSEAQKD